MKNKNLENFIWKKIKQVLFKNPRKSLSVVMLIKEQRPPDAITLKKSSNTVSQTSQS